MRDYKICLKDILDAIERIENSMKGVTRENFEKDIDIQELIVMRILIIGEAVKNLPTDFRKKYPNVEWNKIAGTRDIIIHSYFKINLDIIWEVIKDKIPMLNKQIKDILRREK